MINELRKSKLIGETGDGKKIYLYDYVEDSVVLKELGRLREVSFRKVGEGVNKKEILISMTSIINTSFYGMKWPWNRRFI